EGGGVTAPGTSLVLVLDVSASMQTREADGTRFDLVRRRARALVQRLGVDEEAMLVTAGARARVVVPWTADHARMQDRLETLEPVDTPTDLAPAVAPPPRTPPAPAGAAAPPFPHVPPP